MSAIEIIGAILGSSAGSALITGLTAFFLARRKQSIDAKEKNDENIAELAQERVNDLKAFFTRDLEERKAEHVALVAGRDADHKASNEKISQMADQMNMMSKSNHECEIRLCSVQTEIEALRKLVEKLLLLTPAPSAEEREQLKKITGNIAISTIKEVENK